MQVGSKIDASWTVDLRGVFWWMLGCFLLNFVHDLTWPTQQKPEQTFASICFSGHRHHLPVVLLG